jgi:hypothetical protein
MAKTSLHQIQTKVAMATIERFGIKKKSEIFTDDVEFDLCALASFEQADVQIVVETALGGKVSDGDKLKAGPKRKMLGDLLRLFKADVIAPNAFEKNKSILKVLVVRNDAIAGEFATGWTKRLITTSSDDLAPWKRGDAVLVLAAILDKDDEQCIKAGLDRSQEEQITSSKDLQTINNGNA